MSEVTQWFDGFKPARWGVYQVNDPFRHESYAFWNGLSWGAMSASKELAYRYRVRKSWCQDYVWRGLAEKPE